MFRILVFTLAILGIGADAVGLAGSRQEQPSVAALLPALDGLNHLSAFITAPCYPTPTRGVEAADIAKGDDPLTEYHPADTWIAALSPAWDQVVEDTNGDDGHHGTARLVASSLLHAEALECERQLLLVTQDFHQVEWGVSASEAAIFMQLYPFQRPETNLAWHQALIDYEDDTAFGQRKNELAISISTSATLKCALGEAFGNIKLLDNAYMTAIHGMALFSLNANSEAVVEYVEHLNDIAQYACKLVGNLLKSADTADNNKRGLKFLSLLEDGLIDEEGCVSAGIHHLAPLAANSISTLLSNNSKKTIKPLRPSDAWKIIENASHDLISNMRNLDLVGTLKLLCPSNSKEQQQLVVCASLTDFLDSMKNWPTPSSSTFSKQQKKKNNTQQSVEAENKARLMDTLLSLYTDVLSHTKVGIQVHENSKKMILLDGKSPSAFNWQFGRYMQSKLALSDVDKKVSHAHRCLDKTGLIKSALMNLKTADEIRNTVFIMGDLQLSIMNLGGPEAFWSSMLLHTQSAYTNNKHMPGGAILWDRISGVLPDVEYSALVKKLQEEMQVLHVYNSRAEDFFPLAFVLTIAIGAASTYLYSYYKSIWSSRNSSRQGSLTTASSMAAIKTSSAAALRDAIAMCDVHSVQKLVAAINAAEQAGVDKLLVKKGKTCLAALKKRRSSISSGETSSSGTRKLSAIIKTSSTSPIVVTPIITTMPSTSCSTDDDAFNSPNGGQEEVSDTSCPMSPGTPSASTRQQQWIELPIGRNKSRNNKSSGSSASSPVVATSPSQEPPVISQPPQEKQQPVVVEKTMITEEQPPIVSAKKPTIISQSSPAPKTVNKAKVLVVPRQMKLTKPSNPSLPVPVVAPPSLTVKTETTSSIPVVSSSIGIKTTSTSTLNPSSPPFSPTTAGYTSATSASPTSPAFSNGGGGLFRTVSGPPAFSSPIAAAMNMTTPINTSPPQHRPLLATRSLPSNYTPPLLSGVDSNVANAAVAHQQWASLLQQQQVLALLNAHPSTIAAARRALLSGATASGGAGLSFADFGLTATTATSTSPFIQRQASMPSPLRHSTSNASDAAVSLTATDSAASLAASMSLSGTGSSSQSIHSMSTGSVDLLAAVQQIWGSPSSFLASADLMHPSLLSGGSSSNNNAPMWPTSTIVGNEDADGLEALGFKESND